jgi:hypothetical protein
MYVVIQPWEILSKPNYSVEWSDHNVEVVCGGDGRHRPTDVGGNRLSGMTNKLLVLPTQICLCVLLCIRR